MTIGFRLYILLNLCIVSFSLSWLLISGLRFSYDFPPIFLWFTTSISNHSTSFFPYPWRFNFHSSSIPFLFQKLLLLLPFWSCSVSYHLIVLFATKQSVVYLFYFFEKKTVFSTICTSFFMFVLTSLRRGGFHSTSLFINWDRLNNCVPVGYLRENCSL